MMRCDAINAMRRVNRRRLTTSMNEPGNKIKVNQALVEAQTTHQGASNKHTTYHLRVDLSRLCCCCSRNGATLCCSRFYQRHRSYSRRRSSSTRSTACYFSSAIPTCRWILFIPSSASQNPRHKIEWPKIVFYGGWTQNTAPPARFCFRVSFKHPGQLNREHMSPVDGQNYTILQATEQNITG